MNFHKDEQLIKRLQSGDADAFNEIYEKYYKPLLYTAYRITHNIEDAKDAVQSSFMQMFCSIQNLKEPKYFRLWMNKIVRGKCIDMFQKNKDVIIDTSQEEVINQYEESNTEFIPHDMLKFTADQDILMKLIDELPDRYQEILFYAYFYQFTMQEIAELLEIPVGTVKSRLYAAKKALRTKVEEYEEFNHYKITFRLPGAISVCLFLSFHKLMNPPRKKSIQLKTQSQTTIMTILACAVIGIVVSHVINIGNYHSHSADIINGTEPTNAQEAYFKLKNWAVDEVQMSEKKQSEINDIEPTYNYLKKEKGAYWQRIQADGWDTAYERLKNKSN